MFSSSILFVYFGPNRGIPNIMARQNNHAATIDPSVVPDKLAEFHCMKEKADI